MPRVSLVGAGHGGSEDYATLTLWWAAESGIDYGSQIEAVLSGSIGSAVLSGAPVHGAAAYAKVGEEYDGTNDTLCPQAGSVTVSGVNISIKQFRCFSSGTPSSLTLSGQDSTADEMFIHKTTNGTAYNPGNTSTGRKLSKSVIKCETGADYCQRISSNSFTYETENCLFFGADINGSAFSSASSPSKIETNNFAFNNTGADYNDGGGAVYTTCASEDATGSSGLTGYTSAELVNFAGGDYRTKAISVLATAGTGPQGFIGAFLEASSGISVTVTEALNSFADSSSVSIDYNVSATITEALTAFTDSSALNIEPQVSITASITELLNPFNENSSVTIVEAGNVALSVTESLSPFVDSSVVNVSANIELLVTEVLNSFLDGSNVTIAKDITLQVTETLSGFADNSFLRLPANWTDKPVVVTNYTTQTPVNTIWTDKG
tara:strand:- start:21915 stop:23222 length:1308 start_codon:yes stop_codon:yes gene_type:complete